MVRANSTCRICGHDLLFIHGHGECRNRRCLYQGVNQAPCCEGDQPQVPSVAQNSPQGAPDSTGGGGAHRNRAGAQNGR